MIQCGVVALILHFRTEAQTLRCLQSLFSEGVCNAVLVDNSQDGGRSRTAMKAELEALRARGMQIEVLAPSRNLGFAAGVNLGLAHVRRTCPGPVLLMNTDAYPMQGALPAMKACLSTSRDVVVPAVRAEEDTCGRPLIVHYHSLLALYLGKPFPGTVAYPSGCCLLLGSELLDVALFDDDFFFYGEDVLLGKRLCEADARVVPCTDAAVVHSGSLSSRNGSLFYEYHMVRAHWLLAGKLARNRFDKWAGWLFRSITLPSRALLRSVRSRSLSPVRGFWLASFDLLRGRFRDLTPPLD